MKRLLLFLMILSTQAVYPTSKDVLEACGLSFVLSCSNGVLAENQQELIEFLTEMPNHVEPDTFKALCTKLNDIQAILGRSLNFGWLKTILVEWFVHYKLPELKMALNASNQYHMHTAQVTLSTTLSEQELNFCSMRKINIKHSLEKVLGRSIEKPLTIGFASSGGGYRAMIVTLGFMQAFEDLGILDSLMYIASLSGSTWLMIPWIYSNLSIREYKERLLDKIDNNCFGLDSPKVLSSCSMSALINNIIWPKLIFNQPISSVDLFGALLSKIFLSEFKDMLHKKKLSEQMDYLTMRPFPIYTAISLFKKHQDFYDQYHYDWYEFNPIEVRNLDLEHSFPAWAFASPFEYGKSIEIAPEQSIGYLMGICGSAYTVTLEDINRLYFQDINAIPPWTDFIERIKYELCSTIIGMLSHIPLIGQERLSPAKINNPFKNMKNFLPTALTEKNKITLIDAGISYNLPGRPLLRPERAVDIIIFGDASNNVMQAKELYNFFQNAYQIFGYRYTQIDSGEHKTIHFFKDLHHPQAPAVIYLNFLNDATLLSEHASNSPLENLIHENQLLSFDAQRCIEKEYCGTFNFSYSAFEFKQLSAIAEFNVKANYERIRTFIDEIVNSRS